MNLFQKKFFPQAPGVYWFLNQKKQVIYVGKAKNIKTRLASYRLIQDKSPKTLELINQTKSVKFLTTGSEFEALLLEAELINTYQPHYNILLKDDKSLLYIVITKETYPCVLTARKNRFNHYPKASFYGPYQSAAKTCQVLKILRRIFPFCNATAKDKLHHRACFYSHLNLCPGACTGQISPQVYAQNIRHLKLLLNGRISALITNLKSKLKTESKLQQFEQAAVLRDQILALQTLNQPQTGPDLTLPVLSEDVDQEKLLHLRRLLKQFICLPSSYPLTRIEAYDVSHLQGKNPTGSMVVFANGRPALDQYRIFKIQSLTTPDDLKMLQEVLSRRLQHHEWGIPNLIVVDGGKTQVKAVAKVIPLNIPLVGLTKNPDRLVIAGKTHPLPVNNPAAGLLQHLRNESHRFAKKLHTKLRDRL